MPEVSINYLAVLVAAIAGMVVGAVWYSPAVFGNAWMKAIGKKTDQLGDPTNSYLIATVLALVLAYVMAHFVDYVNATTFGSAAQLASWLWLGFVVTTQGVNAVFEGKPRDLFLISAGHHLAEFIVVAAILALWQ